MIHNPHPKTSTAYIWMYCLQDIFLLHVFIFSFFFFFTIEIPCLPNCLHGFSPFFLINTGFKKYPWDPFCCPHTHFCFCFPSHSPRPGPFLDQPILSHKESILSPALSSHGEAWITMQMAPGKGVFSRGFFIMVVTFPQIPDLLLLGDLRCEELS